MCLYARTMAADSHLVVTMFLEGSSIRSMTQNDTITQNNRITQNDTGITLTIAKNVARYIGHIWPSRGCDQKEIFDISIQRHNTQYVIRTVNLNMVRLCSKHLNYIKTSYHVVYPPSETFHSKVCRRASAAALSDSTTQREPK